MKSLLNSSYVEDTAVKSIRVKLHVSKSELIGDFVYRRLVFGRVTKESFHAAGPAFRREDVWALRLRNFLPSAQALWDGTRVYLTYKPMD